MKKRLLCCMLTLLMCMNILSVGVFAADVVASGTCGDNLEWTIDYNAKLTISGTGEMRNYRYSSVPWDRYTSIIKSVVIEEGVTTIGDCAFNGGFEITNVDIQGDITRIGDLAFSGCELIRNIALPDSLLTIGESAFYDCNALEKIVIPQKVTSIGDRAFYMCYGLTDVAFGSSVTSIGEEAFFLCNKLTSIILPSGLTNIDDGTFWGCSSLTDVVLAGGIKNIGKKAFAGCGIESILIPDTVTSIGESAFWNCKSLKEINIPSNVTSIGKSVFLDCSSLTDITFHDNISSIGSYAFSGCESLTDIIIPESITAIYGYAFNGCSTLSRIKFEGNAPKMPDASGYASQPEVFASVEATAYYPADDNTWTLEVRDAFGGNITWVSYGDKYEVSVLASPTEGGTVTGGGSYKENASATIKATANDGYKFVSWIENGNVVSTDESYSFTVTKNSTLTAVFETIDYVAEVSINNTSTKHENFSSAIAAVANTTESDNAIVKLLDNVDLGIGSQEISSGIFTIDLGGNTLCNTNGEFATLVINGGNITITDSGTDGAIIGNTSNAIDFDGGILNIQDGTISGFSSGITIRNGTVIIAGGDVFGGDYAAYVYTGTLTISGGAISGNAFDLEKKSTGNIVLTLADGKTQGATFPGGIKVYGTTLAKILDNGVAYWQKDNQILLTDNQTGITNGDVVIKAEKVPHTHCVCCGNTNIGNHTSHTTSKEWTPWDGSTKLTSGYYYLTNDVVFDKTMVLNYSHSAYLCLNGHTISCADTVFDIYSLFNLTVTDCQNKGEIETTGENYAISNNKSFTLYGGTICGGDITIFAANNTITNVYGGTVSNTSINAINTAGTVNVYGGTIYGDDAAIDCQYLKEDANAIVVNIYGGIIDGGITNYRSKDTLNIAGGSFLYRNSGWSISSSGITYISAGTFNNQIYNYGIMEITGGSFLCDHYPSGSLSNHGTLSVSGGSFTHGIYTDRSLYLSNTPTVNKIIFTNKETIYAKNQDQTDYYKGDPIELIPFTWGTVYPFNTGDILVRQIISDHNSNKFYLNNEWAETYSFDLVISDVNLILGNQIIELSDNDITVTGINESYEYIGTSIKPNVISIKYGDIDLEYVISYGENKNVVDGGSVTIALTGNYSGEKTIYFDITPKTVDTTITVKDKIYDGKKTAEIKEIKVDDLCTGDFITITGLTATFADGNVGTQKTVTIDRANVLFAGTGSSNYTVNIPTTVQADITARELTVIITPNGGIYGATITAATAELDNVVDGETVEVTLTYTDGKEYNSTDVPSEAGIYIVTATICDSNYTLNETGSTATFEIAKADLETPDASVDYANEMLTRLLANVKYSINSTEYTANADGKIAIDNALFGTTVSIFRTGDSNHNDSVAQSLELTARPAAPSDAITVTNETSKGQNDGKISGITSAMEYSTDDGATWNIGTGEDLTDLTAGTSFFVRIKATDTAPHGESSTYTIGEGNTLTVLFNTKGGSQVQAIIGLGYNTLIEAPAAPTKDHYRFDGWYKESTCENKWNFVADRVTQDTTLYAKWTSVEYIITFDPNGGSCNTVNMTTGKDFTLDKLPKATRFGTWFFDGWYTEKNGGTKITTDTVFTENTTVYAHWNFIYIPVITPTYPPVVEDCDNGDVSVTPAKPEKGDTVIVTPDPDAGYEIDAVVVTDKNGNPVVVTDNGDGTYSFKQPSGKVTIEVTYKEIVIVDEPCDGTYADNCPSLSFTDVDRTQWYHEAIDYVIENGLMNGVGDNLFDVDGMTTRAQIVSILWRLEGEPIVNYLMNFEDVTEGQWYTEAIRWAASEGIINGYGNGKFGTNDSITREQLATILYRYEQNKGGGFMGMWMYRMDFIDLADVSDWAFEAIAWCNMNGIINGKGENILDPKGNAKRCEAAAMLMSYIDKED